jgi:hypothetical protein
MLAHATYFGRMRSAAADIAIAMLRNTEAQPWLCARPVAGRQLQGFANVPAARIGAQDCLRTLLDFRCYMRVCRRRLKSFFDCLRVRFESNWKVPFIVPDAVLLGDTFVGFAANFRSLNQVASRFFAL